MREKKYPSIIKDKDSGVEVISEFCIGTLLLERNNKYKN